MKNSIHKDIFYSSIAFSSVILIIFGFFFANTLYQSGMETAHSVIKQRNYAVNFFIDGFVSKANNTIEILAADERVQNAPFLPDREKQELLSLYRLLSSNSEYVSYIYSAYESKDILLPDFTPPASYDPTQQPWYISIVADKPNLSTGSPYFNSENKNWSFSSGKALFSKSRGFTGIIAIDSPIYAIVDQLQHFGDLYDSSYSFVAKPDGEIIIHPDDSMLHKNVDSLFNYSLFLENEEGEIEQSENNLIYYSHCSEVDWVVVTVVDSNEITSKIKYKILLYIIITGSIAILLGFSQSHILSKRFSKPLIQLQCKVKSVLYGQGECDPNFKYPENEIGLISEEISRLTSEEFFAKSQALQKSNQLLEKTNSELHKLSITDPLTGLYNRNKIDTELNNKRYHSARSTDIFSLLILDIDWFKKINDNYGHLAGDEVIKDIAKQFKDNSRDIDIVGRWGGEEFIIICPQINLGQALGFAGRIRKSIEEYSFPVKSTITVSIGVSEFNGIESISELIKRTDDHLYSAKNNGRNCVVG